MVWFVLSLLAMGLVAGALARLVVPGHDPIGCLGTMVLGVVGSFVGGFLGYLLFGHDVDEGALQPAGILGSFVGAVIALLLLRMWWRRRGRAHPSAR